MRFLVPAVLALVPSLVVAQSLTVPGSPRLVATKVVEGTVFDLPVAPWNGETPSRAINGQTEHQVMHLPRDAGAIRVVETLSEQLMAQGYTILLDCRDFECGGFDFRFALDLIDPPDMFVDLGYFRYVSAVHPDGRAIAVLASRTQDNVHLHITTILPPDTENVAIEGVAYTPAEALIQEPVDMVTYLATNGRFVLSDLEFQVGSSQLDGDSFTSLDELANYLSANPQITIALVGHTDATGSLEANIALSKKRAGAVRTLVLDRYGIAPERVAAEGMGYLSPVATNTTELGRDQNRRVEVIVTSTE